MDGDKTSKRVAMLFKDRYLQALLVLCVMYVIYWVLYGNYQYSTFSDQYYDIGALLSTMYQHIYCPSNVVGLQYLVFSNHISPFLLLVVPLFAAYPSATTLFAVQDTFLALTAIAIYLVCADILKNRKIGLALAFVFLINPAVRGLTLFDFHEEAFVPLFYILSFYFFWKTDRKYFVIAYSLMLSLFEPAIVVGLALLIGLLFYELLCKAKKTTDLAMYKKRIRLIAMAAVITLLFGIFYFGLDSYLLNSYQSAQYSSVSPISYVIPYLSQQIGALTNSTTILSFSGQQSYIAYYGPIGLAIQFLGFGATSLVSPILSMILLSPWLGELFIINNVTFAYPQFQNLGFFAGASAVAAIMGLLIIKEKKTFLSRWINYDSKKFEKAFLLYTLASTIILSYVILIGTNSLASLLLRNATAMNYSQIDGVLATIPLNASVLAQVSIAPHLYMHCDLELPPIVGSSSWYSSDIHTVFWFKPDYIVADKNLPEYDLIENNGAGFELPGYVKGNYTLEYNNSDIYLFKKNG